MRKFFKLAALAAIAVAFVGCGNDKPGPDSGSNTPSYTQDLKFTLTLEEVEADQAKIVVEHNGTTQDTWYGFATTETDIVKAIADVLAKGNLNLQNRTKYTARAKNLEPDTDYTYITFGVTADGKTYGEPAYIEFTTKKAEEPTPPAPEGYTVNPNWTVTYIGEYEEQGKVFEHVVLVESSDTNPFFITAWPVDYFEELGIETIVDEEIKAWNEMLAKYPGATWADIVSDESTMADTMIDPEYGTKWYAMAIGCDTNGKATGLYALSEVIDLENLGGEEEEPTAQYAAWLGDWTFTGANGVAWPITFSKGKANKSFIMTGWEEQTDLPVKVEWDGENGIWAAMIQNLGTYEFDGGQPGDIWFTAFQGKNFFPVEGIPAFLGGHDENGGRLAIAYEPQDENGNTITFDKAGFVASIGGSWYTFTGVTEFPTFPITITPATKATTYAVKEFKGGKKTLNPLAPKTFKAFSLCDMAVRTF